KEYRFYIDADYDRIIYILEGERDKLTIVFDMFSELIGNSTNLIISFKYNGSSLFAKPRVNEIINYFIQKLNECKGPVAQPG
ncbi:MAG: hypothetical protein QW250_05655, partial [Sulfolobaceae archaeon]